MATSLLVGMEERDSAKRRRQADYRQDLELQMRERLAAKQRERLQDMSVDASGWLDPEKRPERLKPLGGVHWADQRGRRDERVRPYHTLFLYGRDDHEPERGPAYGTVVPGSSVDVAYSSMGARDLGYAPTGGSIVQPVTLPYSDNRPIIIHGGGGGSGPPTSRTIVEYRDDGSAREMRSMLTLVQAEKDRMRRDNDDFQRRMQRNLEDEKRRLHDQEEDARRRLERMRRDAEENKREAERQRREAERLRREAATRPKSERAATPKAVPYYETDEYLRRMMAERKKMEDLLKAPIKPKAKDIWDVEIVKKPRFKLNLPRTPTSADKAKRENVLDFHDLKQRDFLNRDQFRRVYPDVPLTNRQLEEQQEALLRHQGANDGGYHTDRPRAKRKTHDVEPRRAVSRPGWLDRTEYEQTTRTTKYRNITPNSDKSPRNRGTLTLRNDRRYSTDTLTDETWIFPSLTADI